MLSIDDNTHVHSLPPFASAENKALSQNIRELESKLNSLLSTLDDNVLRTDSMVAHMKNVQQELSHTQALSDAKVRQIQSEDHFKQLAEREAGRLAVEIRRMDKEIAELSDHITVLQNNIYRGNERIEAIRGELKLEKDELDEWLRVQAEKEEDNLALVKYTKEDDTKVKELSLNIEKLMQDVTKKKAILNAEVTETQVAQIELDKTTEAFRQLHQDRQDLIHQWESTIRRMQQRDTEIAQAQETFRELKEEIMNKQKTLNEKQEFLEQQHEANTETEKNIALAERNVAKIRSEQQQSQQSLLEFRDELDVLRSTLNKTAADLVNRKSEVSNLEGELQDKHSKLKQEQQTHESTKAKMEMIMDKNTSMEVKAKELQELLRLEELRKKELDRELKMLRESQFKKNQEVFRLRQEEKNLGADIAGGEAALRNLGHKVHKLDQESAKQQAMLYAAEYQIQQMERKLRRAQGERTDEEKEELMRRIDELNTALEEQTAKWNLLNGQFKKSQDDVRSCERKLEALERERMGVDDRINELNLYNDSAAKQFAVKTREKEDLMVEEHILRLELRKLRSFLHARADEVFSLENRQLHLQLALEERTKEIEIHKDMLRLQLKNAEEERYSAAAELRDRVGKVERLKRRYEIVMTHFASEDGEEEHSQAFYVIRAAQQREELQREGDELDAKIRKAEKEIKALENTLKMLNNRNEEYRFNLYKAELSSKDLQHRDMLEQEYWHAMERYKHKRADIQSLQQELMEAEREFSAMTNQEASCLRTLQSLENGLAAMRKEVAQQQAKKERAAKSVQRSAKEFRKTLNLRAGELAEPESDFKIRELKEMGNLALEAIEKVTERHLELGPRVNQLLEENGVAPASRVVSRMTTRPPSRAGSVASDAPSERSTTTIKSSGLARAARRSPTVRSPTGVGSGAATPTRTMSTTNMNGTCLFTNSQGYLFLPSVFFWVAAVALPTVDPPRSGVMSPPRGPITGSGRIKAPARPTSATSVSSTASRRTTGSSAGR
ncbi:coiled-coil domain-containing 39-like protein [Gaertneriomyces semiglobifer]|nr:coiled-coil domain-containing 39-like protein [Gaertneriomyces semiglobifer]